MLDGEWLFVANNGRKVIPMNLLGLSRFFVHATEDLHALNEETIGRFGIGFKSSYLFTTLRGSGSSAMSRDDLAFACQTAKALPEMTKQVNV